MAVDAALLTSVAEGAAPVLRTYRWSPACLSFGRNQAACGVYDPDLVRAAGIDVVRRPTGGLAVLHDCELTYAVIAPAATFGGPRRAYHRIHEAIAAALRALGVGATLASARSTLPLAGPPAVPCFAEPAGGEVIARGRKLVGSAQRCERRTILQHGSILMSGRQSRVEAFGHDVASGVADGSIALDEILGAPPPAEHLASELLESFVREFGLRIDAVVLDSDEEALATELEAKYRDESWTWRR